MKRTHKKNFLKLKTLNSNWVKPLYGLIGILLGCNHAFAFTLPAQPIRSYACKDCKNLSHDNLNTSWSIENKPLFEEILHAQTSRKFSIKSSSKELRDTGVTFSLQAPGAVIRMLFTKKKQANSSDFFIQAPCGKHFDLKQASNLFSEEELKITELEDAFTLQLKPELGFGRFKLKSVAKEKKGSSLTQKDMNKDTDDEVLIYVYDKEAPTYLVVETDKARYKYGEELKTTVRLRDEENHYPIEKINAFFIPNYGKPVPLKLNQNSNNVYEATVNLTIPQIASRGDNGYISVQVESTINDLEIKREGHTAWSYAIPSATLNKVKAIDQFTFLTELKVATSSRYALEGILYGSDSKNKMQPIQMAQTATWLSPGNQKMTLSFDPKLNKSYSPPYFLGNLRLIDYYQLKPVHEYPGTIPLSQLNSD